MTLINSAVFLSVFRRVALTNHPHELWRSKPWCAKCKGQDRYDTEHYPMLFILTLRRMDVAPSSCPVFGSRQGNETQKEWKRLKSPIWNGIYILSLGGSSLKNKRAGFLSDTEGLSYTLAGTGGFRENWPQGYWWSATAGKRDLDWDESNAK